MRMPIFLILMAILCQSLNASEPVILSNKDGKIIECYVEGYDSAHEVTVKLLNGRTFRVPFDSFDESSQQIIREEIRTLYKPQIKTMLKSQEKIELEFNPIYIKEYLITVKTANPFEQEVRVEWYILHSSNVTSPEKAYEARKRSGKIKANLSWESPIEDIVEYKSTVSSITLIVLVWSEERELLGYYGTSMSKAKLLAEYYEQKYREDY